MSSRALSVPAALLLVGCTVDQAPPTTPCDADPAFGTHPRAAAYSEVLQAFWDANRMPAAVVGIQRGDEAPWVGALGHANLDAGSAMQTCTPFRTGSVSKLALAVVAMQLIEEGAIGLDQPVAESLPEVGDEIRGGEAITLRQLLDHSSGVRHPSEDDLGYQLSILDDPEAAAARPYGDKLEDLVYGHALHFPAGTDSRYSNGGTWLVARVVETLTGQPVAEALEDRLFAPHGLDSLRLVQGDDPAIARGYVGMDGVVQDVTAWDRADSDGDPAGGLAGNAADLLAFGRLLFDGDLVQPETLAEMMLTPSFPSCPDGDCGYGLGMESVLGWPSPGFGKNGSLPGVDANLFVFPDQDLVLVAFASWGAGNHKDAFDALFE